MIRLDRGRPGPGLPRSSARPLWEGGSPGVGSAGDDRVQVPRFAAAVLDSLTARVALLDESGTILAVNRSWRQFAVDNGAEPEAVSEGADYLAVCERAADDGVDGAAAFLAAARDVLAGRVEAAEVEYPCDQPGRPSWFVARLTRLRADGPPRLVVAHEDVTDRKLAEMARAQTEAILHHFFQHVPILIGIVELEDEEEDPRFVLVNAATAGYMGLEPHSVAGRRASELGIPRPLVNFWLGKYHESRRAGKAVHFPYVKDSPFGPRRMSGTACYLGVSPEGRHRYAYFAQDITESRLAEQTIAEQIRVNSCERDLRLALIRDVPLREMMAQCAEAMVGHLGAEFAWIWTLGDGDDEVLELRGADGPSGSDDGPPERVSLEDDFLGRIARRRLPYLSEDPAGDPELARFAWAARPGRAAFAAYPLLVEDRLVGLAAMVARDPLPEATARSLLSMSHSLALGIERKRAEDQVHRLNEQLRQRLRRTAALRRIDAVITASRDLGRNLGLIAEAAIHQLGADAATILTRAEDGRLRVAAARGLPPEDLGRGLADPDGLPQQVTRVGRPLCIPDLAAAHVVDPRVRPAGGGGDRRLPRRPAQGRGAGRGAARDLPPLPHRARRRVARLRRHAGRAGRHRRRQRGAVRGPAPLQPGAPIRLRLHHRRLGAGPGPPRSRDRGAQPPRHRDDHRPGAGHGSGRGRAGPHPPRRPAARHRQARRPRRHPPQGGGARRGRMGSDAAASRLCGRTSSGRSSSSARR